MRRSVPVGDQPLGSRGVGDQHVQPPTHQRGPDRPVLGRTTGYPEPPIRAAKLWQGHPDDQLIELGGHRLSILGDEPQIEFPDGPAAFACTRNFCSLPVTDPAAIPEQLDRLQRAIDK